MRKYVIFVGLCFAIAIGVFLSGVTMATYLAVSVLIGAIIADTITTYLCLKKKGKEGNPVIAFLFRRLKFAGTVMLWLSIWIAILWWRILPAGEQAQTAVAIAYWAVPINNLWVLRRLGKKEK